MGNLYLKKIIALLLLFGPLMLSGLNIKRFKLVTDGVQATADSEAIHPGSSSFAKIAVQSENSDCKAPFEEKNGLLVVEIESVKPATGWQLKQTFTGYTGTGYFEWLGGDKFSSQGSGLLTYKVKINTPGTYRFQWRSKVGSGTNSTEHNDSWLRIPDAADFYGLKLPSHIVRPKGVCTNDCPSGAGGNGWFKIYSSGTTDWTWVTKTSDNDAHDIYAKFDTAGVYTIEISGRSNHHILDRFVLYNSNVNPSDATHPDKPETRCTTIAGLFEEEEAIISFFPNPASESICFSEEIEKGVIFDMMGNEIFTVYDFKILPISHLARGVYVLRLTSRSNKQFQYKFLKP